MKPGSQKRTQKHEYFWNCSVKENTDERILKMHNADLRLKTFLSQRSEYLDEENDSLDVVSVDEDDM